MPGLPCHVNIFWDPTMGALTHNFVAPGPPLPPAPVPSVEMICMQMWTLGYLTGQNKFTTTVKHSKGPIVIEGHDIGMMIPDLTLMQPNLMQPVIWPFTSRKIQFTASTVKMDGKMVGCAGLPLGLPMMTCGDPVSVPSAFPLANWTHTLTVGITPADISAGWHKAFLSMAIDVVFAIVGKVLAGRAPAVETPPFSLADEFKNKIVGDTLGFAKKVVGAAAGVALDVYEGRPPKFEIKYGVPGIREVALVVTPGSATLSVDTFGGQDSKVGGAHVNPRVSLKRNKDGSHTPSAAVGKAPPKKKK